MAKLFSFRFDVDTHRCVHDGMPALVELGASLGAPFTFFVNMGRAVSRRDTLLRRGRPSGHPEPAAKLSARRKLGSLEYVRAAVMNPAVGAAAPGVVRSAAAAGHEIGLHGGTNHATWQRFAPEWSEDRVADEIDAVLPTLAALLAPEAVVGFASPGWSSSQHLPTLLEDRGFRYVADEHGPGQSDGSASGEQGSVRVMVDGMHSVRTALTGEPGGVAYLEHLVAIGLDEESVAERFQADLVDAGDRVIAYDHPYFAGVEAIGLVRRCIEVARDAGYTVVPVREIVDAA